jgi:sigma-B regulation protein RsbU (phosphoserine phosphatase)
MATMMANVVDDGHTMQCMEVWGGNRAIDAGVRMSGLDAWVYSRPFAGGASSVDAGNAAGESGGGDIHYLSSCMTGRISRMLVADVSGHGSAVDSTAVALRDLMRRYVNYLDQAKMVEGLNIEFGTLAKMGLFATAVVATYWAPSSYLVATNAGHPRPLIYRAKSRAWSFLESERRGASERSGGGGGGGGAGKIETRLAESDEPSNLPLGILEPTKYDQIGTRLEMGDMVLIYTDSLVESRGRDGTLLGDCGLLEVIRKVDAGGGGDVGGRAAGELDPKELIPKLVEALRARQGSESFSDDLTCLLLRRNEVESKVSLYDVAAGTMQVLRQGLARLTGKKGPAGWPEFRMETIGGAFIERLSRRWKGG